MVEEVLVGRQLTPDMIASGETLLKTLDQLSVTVKGAYWLLLPEPHNWRLILVVPDIHNAGPKAIYRVIRSALSTFPRDVAGIGTKDIYVVDDKDPLFLLLRVAVKTGPGVGGVRFSRHVVNGQLIEDAYIYRLDTARKYGASGYFEIKSAANGQFMFNLKAGNHEIILTSERYTTKAAAENGISSVKTNSTNDAHFHRKTAKDNSPYFVLVAGNGQTIGKSEMYSSTSAMENGIKSVMTNAPGAATKDLAT